MRYYTAEEVAKKLKVSRGHVYELVKRGQLKKKEGMGKAVRIPSTELKNANVKKEREYFSYNEELVQVIDTHLGKVRKVKEKDEYVVSDLAKILGLKDSYTIVRRADKKQYKKIDVEETQKLGIFANSFGLLLITYKGIVQYSKKSRSKYMIHFDRLLKELKVKDYKSVEIKEEKETNQLTNMFENKPVEVFEWNGQVLFELYSTGMALGYARDNGKSMGEHGVHKLYPYKSRIDKVLENADIKPYVHSGQRYLTEEQLYDFMLEARTEKCKSFRKWVTNDVLPTIRKTGGYVDNADKFTDNYFSNLSLEVRKAIKQELVYRNKVLVNRKRELIVEAEELKREYDINNKTIEQLKIQVS
ncbi:BRO family protein [uncultured Clostridium sp.]|uniref:BRO family protein n=1 Tax=uncultured Clostridium sp. TaxID=59620 RepID=UPI0025F6A6EF|nr:BRO family protein [uncultured Clostridium sp.]